LQKCTTKRGCLPKVAHGHRALACMSALGNI